MADYEVTETCFIHGKKSKPGDIIKFEGKAPSYLKAVKADPKKKQKK
jgi:hypothetical protein